MIDDIGRDIIAQRNGLRDSLVYSPSEIKAEAETTNTIISQLYNETAATPKIPQATRYAFYTFVNEWVAFYKNHTGWFDRLWFSNLEKITDYRKRAGIWRTTLEKKGLKSVDIPDVVKAPGFSADSIPWKWIVLGALGLVGVALTVSLVRTAVLGGAMDASLAEAEAAAIAIADAQRRKRSSRSVLSIA